MKFKTVLKKKIFWKTIAIGLLCVQIISSCRHHDDFKPIAPPTAEGADSLKSFKDYTFSSNKLIFPDVIEGRLQPNGNRNKPTSVGWTHPSVLYFDQKWNNYKYWMAITPYPSGINEYENPTILCSENGLNWKEPQGIVNPIEKSPEEPGYNSDVNLLFDNGKLYCFWRGVSVIHPSTGKKIEGRCLLYKTSVDGTHWSDKKIITDWNYTGIDLIAPSILKDGDHYCCYGVSTGESSPGTYFTNYAIRRTEVKNIDDIRVDKTLGYNLVKIKNRPWGEDEEPWHLEAKKFQDKWYILVSTTRNNQHGNSGRLFFGVSDDGINFKFGNRPICPITYAYKSSFELFNSKKTGVINMKLWRSSSTNWCVYYDEFSLEGYFG